MRIAVLITCFNRKDKTVKCLENLQRIFDGSNHQIDIHLTDDGCTDGTAEAVLEIYPNATIYKGGNLFWAGGMRLAWKGAISKGIYDYYLLLNDDTYVNEYLLKDFEEAHKYGQGKSLIVGNTCDPVTKEPTYVAVKCISKIPFKCQSAAPNGSPQQASFAGANIWFVPKCIVDEIGVFPNIYVHGVADNDYCWRVLKHGFNVLSSSHYCGYCEADHCAKSKKVLQQMTIRERWKHMFSPKGQEFKQQLYFQWCFFPWRFPFALGKGLLRILFGI